MSFEVPGARALDDMPCRYGDSKLLVRGPRRSMQKPFVVFLGGNETFGKFVELPFAALTERAIGTDCVNLGCLNAGVDAYIHDPSLIEIASRARAKVVQVLGAQNLSNRYYRVHPRRNDRFLEASPLLTAMYPEVDFTEFHFNGHLITTLCKLSPERFESIRQELQMVWVSRMRLLLKRLGPNTLLLWLRHEETDAADLGPSPLMVNREMLDQLKLEMSGLVEVPVYSARLSGELPYMMFGPMETPVAEQMIGPGTHAEIAERLADAVPAML